MSPTLYVLETPLMGQIPLRSWGLMLTLAFLIAAMVAWRRMGRVGINPDYLGPILGIAILSSIAGARLLHFVMAEPETFFENPLIFFQLTQGGMAFYGGVIAATVCGALYAKIRGLEVLKLADVLAPSIMLGLCIGRLGCFFAGCCHGAACEISEFSSITGGLFPGGEIVTVQGFPVLALVFHPGVGVGAIHSEPVFPTQLWESTAAFTMFLFLSWMWARWRKFDGQILATLMIFYPAIRSTIEGFRGDSIRGTDYLGLFSTSQLVSIPVALIGLAIVAVQLRKGLSPEEPIVARDEDIGYDD